MYERLNKHCPNCGSSGLTIFYRVKKVPVHSVLLMPTRKEALNYRKGNISLGFCHSCGFITNTDFDARKHEYSERYEETQGFSVTFNRFHKDLALRLIKKHHLRKKQVIEIGCGKGEFVNMLCELGENTGYGFDPAYVDARNHSKAKGKVTFIRDFYSEKYREYHADFIACKMTLEHIQNTLEFMQTVRRSIADRYDTLVFFQIPDMVRILKDVGFWDIYYEHCSYFTAGSLARLFRMAQFDPFYLSTDYDDQYLMIEAYPSQGSGKVTLSQEESVDNIWTMVQFFSHSVENILKRWKKQIQKYHQEGKKVVLWGGGSKGVAFLTTLGIREEITYAVDINPYKHGTYLAGTGQEIVSPQFLKEYQPDIVVVMNPIYVEEIDMDLRKLDLQPKILPIDYYNKVMKTD
jgi:SAM-dependent methyltransferase